MAKKPRIGAVHGRFQPFHQGHLRYVLLALDRAELIYIAITNPDAPGSSLPEVKDAVRHLPANNPFTYDERREMVLAGLESHEHGIARRVRIVPLDVSTEPATWKATVPLDALQFVAPHEPWDIEKSRRFVQAGYKVEFLPVERDRITATEVRSRIRLGDPTWRVLVPSGVAKLLEIHDLHHQPIEESHI